jgi:ParB/RepB/Spo0J family partition protein
MARAHKQAAPSIPAPSQRAILGAAARTMVPIASIDTNPWNPRPFSSRPDQEDQRLTASIKQYGVLENLLLRPMPERRHQLIFGERRLRSAIAAGLTEVPAIVREMDDHEARVLTAVENLHHKQLHFLQEAAGVADLVDEHWTVEQVAAKLDKPLSWVARRRRLRNLTNAWRDLAQAQEGWTASWGAAHFEQIAVLELAAQDELLARDRYQLERCGTVRELARLIGSRARALSTFPWPLDDADLDPVAGACSACPQRSSHHPGLFDDQERSPGLAVRKGRPQRSGDRGDGDDRCLNPVCAANKEMLLVARKRAELATRHPGVVLLQDGYLPEPISGALREHQVASAKKGAAGAVPAVVVNGPHVGQTRWVKPREEPRHLTSPRPADAPPQRKSLAERQEQKWRQRKVHAIGLIKTALLQQAPPPLLTSARLAVVFGTAQTNSSSAFSHDHELPRVTPEIDPDQERRRMLGHPQTTDTDSSRHHEPTAEQTSSHDDADANDQQLHEGRYWHAFDALEGKDTACSGYLWARTLRVMLDRMTPNGDWRHVEVAWHEAERVASLVGLQAQEFLDLAAAALPDPKSWAKEKALVTPATTPAAPPAAGQTPDRPAPAEEPPSRRSPSPRLLPAAARRPASRLPR